ncbi:hypothetical protein [Amphibacillus cookii]|uniref:hypothetical protein n=1 Tax=Amphibacillus cookii TaxID=767787 RepID=UPI0019588754|nr:hypothetical protein [Amphibacillus cookii]MBM7541588.1 hypothetical protein [Amphibacillus cookii]
MIKLKDALAGMKTAEKVEYIWEYYKLHIIGSIFLLVFVWLMVNGLLTKDAEPLGITVVSEATLAELETVEEQLLLHMDNDFDILFEYMQHQGGIVVGDSYEMLERLATSIGVGQVDLLVTNGPFAEQLIDENILSPLDEMMELDQLGSSHERLEVDGVTYGIRTADLLFFKEHQTFQDTYLFVPESGRNKEESQALIKYLSDTNEQ